MPEQAMRDQPAGSITGHVTSGDGWPVTHAVIVVTDPTGHQAGRARAQADGGFTADLPPGTYTVIVTAAGHAPLARTAVVQPGRPTSLGVLTLAPVGGLTLPTPGVWVIDPVHSTVRATAVHLGLSRIHGDFTDFSGKIVIADPPENSSVEVVIDAASLDTHNAERDAHLKSADFLDVERFPTITYRSETVQRLGPDKWAMTGPLTMRDVTRPVRLDVTYLGTGPDPFGTTARAAFTATAQLARDEFAMTWDQSVLAGISMFGRTLKITVDVEAVLQ